MDNHQMIPERVAQSILARATQLDAQSPAIPIDELRAIAAELNVSETSLDAALNEYQALRAYPEHTRRRGSLAVAALGLPIGLIGGSLLSGATLFTAPLIWLLLTAAGLLSSTGLIVLQSKRPSLNSYVLHNSLLWGGISVGALSTLALLGNVAGGGLPWVAVLFGVKHWLSSTILGSAGVTAILRANAAKGDHPDVPLLTSGLSESSPAPTRVGRVLGWLKGLLHITLNATPQTGLRLNRSAPILGGSA
jgi:hypothetical protein